MNKWTRVVGAAFEGAAPLPSAELRRLVLMRWFYVAVMAGVVLWMHFVMGLAMPLLPSAAIVAAVLLAGYLAGRRLRRREQIGQGEVLTHLLVDTAGLTGLLFLSGGYTNPFTSLYLLPLAVAASLLTSGYAWTMAGATVACYTLMLFAYLPAGRSGGHIGPAFDLHLIGMWVSFVIVALVVAGFVGRLAEAVRRRDRALAEAREAALRSERVVALGALAAGTAHELGTPLSTMAVLVQDLRERYAGEPALAEDLGVIAGELMRCRDSLDRSLTTAGEPRALSGRRVTVGELARTVARGWQRLRQDVPMRLRLRGIGPQPRLVMDETLVQALVGLLVNAAESGSARVSLHVGWTPRGVSLTVGDRGSGVPAHLQGRLAQPFVTGKQGGRGLGLFLAENVIRRFDGALTLQARWHGGTLARVFLPVGEQGNERGASATAAGG